MKMICNASIPMLLAVIMLSACSKKNTPAPSADISVLATNWVVNQWGGVSGNTLIFTINKNTYAGTVDTISGPGYGFAVGDVIFSNIKANGNGTFSCSASYSPTGSGALSIRSATMSLQNNNTQLTVYYPALNSSFPAITYIFQQTNYTNIAN